MHRNIFSKLSKGFSIFWKNFLSAYPVIIFFVVLFLITVSMFSLQYAMVVSIFTTMFNIQRRRQNSIGNFIKIFFISIFLCLLAFNYSKSGILSDSEFLYSVFTCFSSKLPL